MNPEENDVSRTVYCRKHKEEQCFGNLINESTVFCKKCQNKPCCCKSQNANRGDQTQTVGDQTQNSTESQQQTLGDLTQNPNENQQQFMGPQTLTPQENQQQFMGPQTQNPFESQQQTLGPLTQNPQENQNQQLTFGALTQNPTESQQQTLGSLTQNPSESQQQTLGEQTQTQRHGDQTLGPQTLTNTPTINTPVTVSGVTVNVPVTVKCGCEKRKKKKDRRNRKGECCDCCARALANVLNQIRIFELSNPSETVDIYFLNLPFFTPVPTTGQTITNVNDCSTVSFRTDTTPPTTTVQLCKVAGIRVGATSPDLVQFLVTFAKNNCNNSPILSKCDECDDKCGGNCHTCKNSFCSCNNCANGIGQQLEFAAGLVTPVNLIIESLIAPINGVFLLAICDCLAFFVDDLTTPKVIYAFSLCSVAGFTPVI
ncbi:hypothetical protein [Peribacillus huizhouensis]|uniref:Uncharacterized protein n=1 Tax=Peribacillus huizhouensis TaxID=1501239 RepID=A0ABR6CQX5_9BACI|nr:hypothetical protein [Peribacillus huizhouensis]MBA9027439.1 hypothetical protein [Peribacillus huizhouensis]